MPKYGLLIALLMLGILLPSHSWADSVTLGAPPGCGSNDQYNQDQQGFLNRQNDEAAKSVNNVNSHLSKIQSKLYSCLDGLDLAYSLGPLIHNPLGFLEAAAEAAFWKIVESLVDAICQAVVGAINSVVDQVVASVESLANFACIPLPSLGLSGSIDLGLPKVPCNGTPLIGSDAILTKTPSSSGSGSYLQFLGRQSQ